VRGWSNRPHLEDMSIEELSRLAQDCVAELTRRARREGDSVESRGRERDRTRGEIGW